MVYSRWFLLVIILTTVFSISTTAQKDFPKQTDPLLEVGSAAKLESPNAKPLKLTIVSYNIRWRSGAELQQIVSWLRAKHAAIIALQEVDRAKERTGRANTARELAESLGMYYAWAAPPATKGSKEEETGVALLSPYPLSDVTRIVLPHKGPGGRSRVALGATIVVGKTSLRFYSVHSETRISIEKKLDQLRAVLDDLARISKSMPSIVMGDLNSWEPATVKGVRQLFTREGFSTPFPDDESTFKRDIVVFDLKLKLDWIWLRGFTAESHGIDRSLTVSDHFPLWTVVSAPRTGSDGKS